MKLLLCYILLFTLVKICTACSKASRSDISITSVSASSKKMPHEGTRPEDLEFSAGDIISCSINGVSSHILLASSNSTVIHAYGEKQLINGKTILLEERFTRAMKGSYTACSVLNSWYQGKMDSNCNRRQPYSNEEAVRRARESVRLHTGETLHYSVLTCNCEHWVASWKYGISITYQLGTSGTHGSAYCNAPGSTVC